jgi:D-alanine-D-alanine ligase
MKKLPQKINVICNQPSNGEMLELALSDEDTLNTATEVWKTLNNLGFDATLTRLSPKTLEGALKPGTDLVFNLCEWTGFDYQNGVKVIQMLDREGIPHTGPDARGYKLSSSKIVAKRMMDKLKLPHSPWQLFTQDDEKLELRNFPLILKPSLEHGSVGISQDSVVTDEEDFRKQLAFLLQRFNQPVIAEEYIDGRELKITLLGNDDDLVMLPISEVIFLKGFSSKWKILTFPSKWIDTSVDYRKSKTVCPAAGIEESLKKQLREIALKAVENWGIHDYARMDLRMDKNGRVYILEIDAYPSLENEPGYAPIMSAAKLGWSYQDFIYKIVEASWRRTTNEEHKVERNFSTV